MATIKRFEDLPCWQLARKLSSRFYLLSSEGIFSRDFGLRDQMRRSVVSISSNIAEGFERNGNREFIHYCFVAKASSGEFRSQLYVAFDAGYINETDFIELKQKSEEISKSLSGLINYLQQSEFKGSKFREVYSEEYQLGPIIQSYEGLLDENYNQL